MKKKSKNGEWIYNGNPLITGFAPYRCSKCGTDFHIRTSYCPYCGDKKGI